MMIPTTLTGQEFERSLVMGMERAAGQATMGKYGVKGSFKGGEWAPIPSLPDFEGVLAPSGRQFILDAKASSKPKLDLCKDTIKRQVTHMLDRDRYGAVCFFAIHWCRRTLKTRTDPAETWLMPVGEMRFWRRWKAGDTKAIRRDDCYEYGVQVDWTAPGRARVPRPDLFGAIVRLIEATD